MLLDIKHLSEQDVWEGCPQEPGGYVCTLFRLAKQDEDWVEVRQCDRHRHEYHQVGNVSLVNMVTAELELALAVRLAQLGLKGRVEPLEDH